MIPFDLDRVQSARVTTNDEPTREMHFRQRVKSAFGQCSRTIGKALPALKVFCCLGVRLPALKLFERADMRIRVVEVGNQAKVHLVILSVIHERTAR